MRNMEKGTRSFAFPFDAKQWCLYTYIVLSLLTTLTVGRSLTSLQVPQNAKAGHVVTMLPTARGREYTLRDPHDGSIAKHFSIMQQGQLITNSDVSHLAGQSVYLYVENLHPLEPWSQMLSLEFSDIPSSLYFEGQPYKGYIVENQLPETPVTGLEKLYDSINGFPASVNLSIVSGDVNDFKIVYSPTSQVGIIVSAVMFDREEKSCYHIVLKAEGVNNEAYALVSIHIDDENDNPPAFLDMTFFGMIPLDASPMTHLMQVMANDLDLDDIISYVMEEENDLFDLLQHTGDIFLKDPAALQPQSYELSILAIDDRGAKSKPASVRLEVDSPESSENHVRRRRAAPNGAVFVINDTVTGELFHVAGLDPVEEEQYRFVNDEDLFAINTNSGMVSLKLGRTWVDGVMDYEMDINVTRSDDDTYSEVVRVYLKRVSRGVFDPLFENQPQPITLLVPTWIRPYTPLIRLNATDAALHGAQVQYKIEEGADDRFRIDPDTGDITTFGRFPFTCSDETAFELAVSANVVGVPSTEATPVQVIYVYCDLRAPQFYYSPMNFTIDEMMSTSETVLTIQAKSFFEIPIQYSITNMDGTTSQDFSIGISDGAMKAKQQLRYAFDPHQYKLRVTAREPASGQYTTEDLTINLRDINNYVPVFPPAMYVAQDISEDISTGTSLLDVFIFDLDSGVRGEVNFSVDNDLFEMVTNADGKSGYLRTMGTLDYDRLPERKYELLVTAADGGDPSKTGTGTIQVWMANANDEAPVVQPPTQQVWLKKSLTESNSPVIHVIHAYDPDGDTLEFEFTGGMSSTRWGPFELVTQTGEIKLVAPLSEQEQKYYLTFNVRDTGSCCVNNGVVHVTNGTVVIDFADVNRPPQFPQCDQYNPVLKENEPASTGILTFIATDNDAGSNGELTYDLVVEFPEPEYFGIRQLPSGEQELYNTHVFDRENPLDGFLQLEGKIAYPVTIKAVDKGRYPLSARCFFLVIIEDVNDYIPEFDDSSYVTAIPTSDGPNAQVMRVFAWDRDEGNNAIVSYSIASQPSVCSGPCFQIDSSSGWISVSNSIPSTNTLLTLVVEATDPLGVPQLPNTASVNVTVNRTSSANWLAPEWQRVDNIAIDNLVLEVPEDYYPDTKFIDTLFTAIPMRANEEVSYFIQRGLVYELNSGTLFSAYEVNTGMQIEVNQQLDYEKSSFHILQMRASYFNLDLNLRTLARPRINLEDINDNKPQWYGFDQDGRFPATIEEDALFDAYVTTVFALDVDGTSPNNRVSYYFSDDCSADCDKFTMDEESGKIRKKMAEPFDRTVQSQYTLKVIAKDGDPLTWTDEERRSSSVIAVQVAITGASLNPPTFPSDQYSANIDAGNYFDQPLIQIVADFNIDDDLYPQYSISGGNEKRLFYVNSETGQIYVFGEMKFTDSPYDLTYRVFDGLKFDETEVTITVNYVNVYPPVFSTAVYPIITSITEEQAGSTFMVETEATDPEGTSISYALDGQFYNDDTNRFDITDEGVIWQKKALDRDYPYGQAIWQINAAADDQMYSTSSAAQRGYAIVNLKLIDINDNAPIFDTCCLIGSILEETTGTAGLQVFANDYDEGSNAQVTYSLVDNTNLFYIESTTGIIRNSGTLDRETIDQYTITVRAQDNGSPTRLSTEATVIMNVADINDHAPVFNPTTYEITMPENQPIGSSVTTVYATDEDIGYNALLTYRVEPGTDSNYFYMDSLLAAGPGVVKINQIVDYDSMYPDKIMRIDIGVTDPNPGNSAQATLTITVTDVNDNAPVIVPAAETRTLDEDAEVGTFVANFTATDRDEGINAQFEYFIDYAGSDIYKNFAITTDGVNGMVTVRDPLDRELIDTHNIKVLAVDKGVPAMTGTALLTVYVGDLNEHAPELVLPDYPPIVRAQAGVNTVVADLEVIDRDGPDNGPPFVLLSCQYTFVDCTDFDLQLVGTDQNTLEVRTKKASYSREELEKSEYVIPIILRDSPLSGFAPQTGTSTLTIVIEDFNDNPHFASVKTINVYNYKGEYADIYIGHVYVEDLDDWDRAEKTYTFTIEHLGFSLRDYGDIYMDTAVPEGTTQLFINVDDGKHEAVVTQVIVKVTWLDDDVVYDSGSMRLTDITAKEFVEMTTENGASFSKFQLMRDVLATQLGTASANVDIFSVRDVPDMERTVDIRYSAHGSPYYRSSRLDGIALDNPDKIATDVGVTIAMIPVDECSLINCFDGGCTNKLVTTPEPLLVNTNQSSLVGIDAYIEASCTCGAQDFSDIGENPQECDALSCLNGGTCVPSFTGDVTCACPEGFDGPRCQQLRHSFTGDGWAWYNSLEQCEDDVLSLQFATKQATGLILYNGPWSNTNTGDDDRDYISIELVDGYPKVRINLGSGEVAMTVNGRNSQDVRKLNLLNDGAWHTVHVFKEGMDLRMIVDYCKSSEISEALNTTSEDRTSCEASATAPGDRFVLRVATPLELGGRSKPNVNYPTGITANGFNGCIKNLQHNGILYDLHIGDVGEDSKTQDGCPREDTNCGVIPVNSTCFVGLTTPPAGSIWWTCNPGYIGQDCDIEATVKNMQTTESFMEWYMSNQYNNSLIPDENTLQLMFRTRQENGLVFSSGSFSTLERIRIEIVNSALQLRIDLGSDDIVLRLENVDVSDGEWHTVYVYRHGNQIVLKLDGGEGRYFTEIAPTEAHRLLILGNESFAGADVIYKRFWVEPKIEDSFQDSCIKDIRYNSVNFPMVEDENDDSVGIMLLRDEQTQVNCNSSGCFGVTCVAPLVCIDAWRLGVCMCPPGWFAVPSPVVCTDPCLAHQCSYGACVAIAADDYRCDCEGGYTGDYCNIAASVAVALGTDALIAIIISLLLLLLLIILIFVIFRYRRKDPLLLEVDPEDDIRDNVVNYEEEGAGEEDMLAFDITRLQKPVDPDADSMSPDKPMRREMVPHVGRGAPEPMPNYPSLGPDGKHPNIGDFIDDRMGDADDDPNAPPYDSVREYQYEGSGSQAGSLSSLNSSSTDGDQDYDYLNNWGPQFSKLADLYAGGNDDDDDTSSV